jgi:hypothetical protein
MPTAAGTYNFAVQVADSGGLTNWATETLTINPALTIGASGATLPNIGVAGSAYPATSLGVTGGSGIATTCVVNSGNLPTGLSVTTVSGSWGVSGSIGSTVETGNYTFTVKCTDSQGDAVTSGNITLVVNAAVLSVSGVAASGSPIVGAKVTLKDTAGNIRTSATAADGTYTLNAAGLTPPFLIQVQAPSGNLYSVSADTLTTTIINTHPFTDLIIRSWYSAQGVSIDTAFANPVSMPAPAPANVQIVNNAVTNLVQLWLVNAGISASQFNLISSPFTANGVGLDRVLDESTVNASTGTVTIAAGGTTQTSTIAYNTSARTMTIASTTANSNGTSVSSSTTVVPTQIPQQTALNGINATLAGFANAIDSNGSQLMAAEITPFMAADLLNDGLNQSQYAASLVTNMRGITVSSTQIQGVKSLDLVKGIADVVIEITFTQGGVSQTQSEEFWFENVAAAWLIGGNGRIASIDLNVESRTNEGGRTGSDILVDAAVDAPTGTVTGITITDASGITGWNSTPITQPGEIVETYQPSPATHLIVDLNKFATLSNNLGRNVVPAGTLFTLALTPASGPAVHYTLPSNGFTTELISITSPTSGVLANYTLGAPLPITWTLPTTFAIRDAFISVEAFNGPKGGQSTLECDTNAEVAANATSGTITIPATCGGLPVFQMDVSIGVTGVNGESARAFVLIQ